jgi:hypothetical protein
MGVLDGKPTAVSINLGRMDVYERCIIPDEDIETALKVIRTIRNVCLGPHIFDADGAVVLSHAHAKIHDLVVRAQEGERRDANRQAPGAPQNGDRPEDHARPDPDFCV